MTAHLKSFLLWLLIAALPLQGPAAVGAPQCGAARQHAAEAFEPARAAMDIHATDAVHADHHHAAPCDKDADSASSSSCQACCIGAGLPPAGEDWMLPQHHADQPHAAPDILLTGHIAGGIERPPKLS